MLVYLFYNTKFTIEWDCGFKQARSINMNSLHMLSNILSTPIYYKNNIFKHTVSNTQNPTFYSCYESILLPHTYV